MDVVGNGSDTLLEETFYIFSKKNTVYKVKLTRKGLLLVKESNGQTKTEAISINDIVGAHCMRSKVQVQKGSCICGPNSKKKDVKVVEDCDNELDQKEVCAYLYIYAYVLKKSKVASGRKREKMTITLRFRSFDTFQENMREAERWRIAIKCLIRKMPLPGSLISQGELGTLGPSQIKFDEIQPILVLVNPKSGPGRAKILFQTKVLPVLNEAEVSYDLIIAKHANYSRDFVRLKNIYQWRGIVAVGGDGLLFEIINGVFERPDWENVISQLSFGIVPCGSGNGLAKSIAHANQEPHNKSPYITSALNITSGNTVDMDIVRVETKNQIMFSFLTIGWGILADIDIESEKLRAIGSQRFSLWSVSKLIGLRTYRGKIMYLRIKELNKSSQPKSFTHSFRSSENLNNSLSYLHSSRSCGEVYSNLSDEIINLETSANSAVNKHFQDLTRSDSFYSINSRRSTYLSMAGSSYLSVDNQTEEKIEPRSPGCKVRMYGPASNLPSLIQPVPKDWECIDGEFVMVQASYQTHIENECFIVPSAKLSDGVIWLMLVRGGTSRSQMLQILMGLSSGVHIECPQLEVIPVKAFRLEPDMSEKDCGHITVDGECVDYGPIQAEIFPRMISVMSSESGNDHSYVKHKT